jgi:hypothetical protein
MIVPPEVVLSGWAATPAVTAAAAALATWKGVGPPGALPWERTTRRAGTKRVGRRGARCGVSSRWPLEVGQPAAPDDPGRDANGVLCPRALTPSWPGAGGSVRPPRAGGTAVRAGGEARRGRPDSDAAVCFLPGRPPCSAWPAGERSAPLPPGSATSSARLSFPSRSRPQFEMIGGTHSDRPRLGPLEGDGRRGDLAPSGRRRRRRTSRRGARPARARRRRLLGLDDTLAANTPELGEVLVLLHLEHGERVRRRRLGQCWEERG